MLHNKKILISTCDGLGDLIMLTPVLREIKQVYPDCAITILTNEHNKEAVCRLSYIDKVTVIRRKKFCGRLYPVATIIQQDYVIFLDWHPLFILLCYLFQVPHVIGLPKDKHFLSCFFTQTLERTMVTSRQYRAQSIAAHFSEVLGVPLAGDMTHCDISLPTEAMRQRARTLLRNAGLPPRQPYICLAPFTSDEVRNWPVEHIRALVALLREQLQIAAVIVGPPDKAGVAANIGAYDLTGQTSILELVEVINNAVLFVGSDSGPMHIAGAIGKPLIAMFSVDLPSRWAPRRQCQVIEAKSVCSWRTESCPQHCSTKKCMQHITPQVIFQAIEEYMAAGTQ